MLSKDLSTLVERLFTDRVFRQTFLTSPEATLACQAITSEETYALRRLRTRLLMDGEAALSLNPLSGWP